jgi:Bifunctional DNA primase/polymerase, N-terminal
MSAAECGHFTFAPDDPVRAQLGLGVAALRYQELGYAVFPLARATKKPSSLLPLAPPGRGGVYWADRDESKTRWYWQQNRALGVGVACGQASGLLVIDLDVKGMDDGRENFWAFVSRHGLQATLPARPTVSTPSGGQHLWLRTPPGRPVPQRLSIMPGVDIKGDGGYVAAPPTMINVKVEDELVLLPYTWASGCPCSVPPAPEWIFEWIAATPSLGGSGTGVIAGQPVDLDELQKSGLPVGERNIRLYLTACSLFGRYDTDAGAQATVWALIEPILGETTMAGFSYQEVNRTLESARCFVERSRAEAAEKVSGTMQDWVGGIRGW